MKSDLEAGNHLMRASAASGGTRRGLLLAMLAAGVWAAIVLGLKPSDLIPGPGGLRIASEFLAAAFKPALSYESDFVPTGTPPIYLKAFRAAGATLVFASAAMSLALVWGVLLGFLASTAWWAGDTAGGGSGFRSISGKGLRPLLYGGTRILIVLMRSIHELIWAVLFLAAFGYSHLSAAVAIAIPFGGTLAKVFSEMIDEAPRDSANALRSAGATPLQIFFFGLLPRSLPDMIAYAFYRFECALRSSAVLGFFGFPTLGFYIAASFENLYYGEVWTYLYTLFLLVAAMDWWSGALRRRLVG